MIRNTHIDKVEHTHARTWHDTTRHDTIRFDANTRRHVSACHVCECKHTWPLCLCAQCFDLHMPLSSSIMLRYFIAYCVCMEGCALHMDAYGPEWTHQRCCMQLSEKWCTSHYASTMEKPLENSCGERESVCLWVRACDCVGWQKFLQSLRPFGMCQVPGPQRVQILAGHINGSVQVHRNAFSYIDLSVYTKQTVASTTTAAKMTANAAIAMGATRS